MKGMNSDGMETENELSGSIHFICFVGQNVQEIYAPLFYYGNAVKNLYIFCAGDLRSKMGNVGSELHNNPEFSDIKIKLFYNSHKKTDIENYKQFLHNLIPADPDTEIIISISGCSKPVYLAAILFANERNASIILSHDYSSFEIYEDGNVRIQPFPPTIKWYLCHYDAHIYPQLSKRTKDNGIPEEVLKNMPEMIYDYAMKAVITKPKISFNIDFAAVTKKKLILGKMFTEEGKSYFSTCSILADSEEYFGKNCRVLIYAVGDTLYERISEQMKNNPYATVLNLPDSWCLMDYPELFQTDLLKLINKKVPEKEINSLPDQID